MIVVVVREVDVPQTLLALAAIFAAIGVPGLVAAYQSRVNARKIDAVAEQTAKAAAAAITEAKLPSNGGTLGETVEQMGKTVEAMQAQQHQALGKATEIAHQIEALDAKVDVSLETLETHIETAKPMAEWVHNQMTQHHGRRWTDTPEHSEDPE